MGFDLRGSSRFLPHFFLELGGSVGPKGDQGVLLLRIATILYSELLRKVPPTAVYGSTSGCDLRRMENGLRPSRNDKWAGVVFEPGN
jgi:hypothetical protein